MYNNRYFGCSMPTQTCPNERDRLLRQIQALDFTLVDLNLYLDTHPTCANGLSCYQMHKKARDEAVTLFTAKYGPLTVNQITDSWTWACNPWPWELED